MEILKLPAVLPGTLDLVEINLKLKKGEIQLDWNAVISAPESALKILLDGIELKDENLIPDDSGVADQVIRQITTYFDNCHKKQTKKIVRNPEQASLFNVEYIAASQPEKQGSLIEQQFIINPNLTELNPPESPMVNPQSSIINPKSPYELRQELEEMIFNDLLGPAEGEDEEVDESSVTDRYLVGLLSPLIRNKTPEEQPEQQDEFVPAGKGNSEEGTTEGTIPPPNTMFPSSMGLTFCVDSDVKAIKITAKWGHYQREKSQYLTKKETSEPKLIWKRYPIQGTKIQPLKSGEIPEWTVDPEYPGVIVKGRMRRLDNQDWIVTLFLVNGQKEPAKQRDKAWLFQPELMIDSPDKNYSNIFVKKPISIQQNLDPVIQLENQQMAMLYRHQVEFAVGHGVGVHAEIVPDNPTQASGLKTCMIPRYEVPQTTPPSVEEIPQLNGLILDMKTLAEAQPTDVPQLLTPLITAYQNWIQEQQQSLQDLLLNPDFLPSQNAAQTTLNHCQTTLDRIQEGIQLLTQNPQAVEAFQFMNEAMWRQRVHGIYAELKRQGKDPNLDEIDTPNNHSWRTFQLAFILLNLPPLTDLHHPGRSHPLDAVCDLLWFPTGGGKTEAYLGLTAYTIGLRRLQGFIGGRDGEHGVAVLMRYTLRLLTLQQFQRATTLICACEVIRRQNPQKWGSEPFRIGLWVGNNSTPNYTSQSEEFVKQSKGQGRPSGMGSPHQLTNCPWCGTKIDPGKHIIVHPVDKEQGRTLVYCGDSLGRCCFTLKQSPQEGLPIIVVDEEIYRRLPTLLIATVDKFAQMPWKGETQMLFGQVSGYCDRHGFRSPDLDDKDSHRATNKLPAAKTRPHALLRPPDLIIQDELHLISGPLGSMVGLYETVVDHLCTWEVNGQSVRPKVIASTATIRQASAQVHHLFLRKLHIFPPPGLEIQDNFFSRRREPSPEHPGRLYLGICAPGRRLKATMIRVYLATLSAAQALYEKYGKVADPWMTLVGYFNSLRELGGTRRLVEDDIRTRLKRMSERGLKNRLLRNFDELTSRKDSTDIPLILDRLETPFDPILEAENKAKRKAGQKVERPDPLDVILATNMISVGVDIKRLGLMVACGQPKNTAEYIQATSRVGRSYPGLVITVYNWARPRDLSHYERFEHYHATFYQHVEALSVTPFASGALYRGLSALFVSLVRLCGDKFNQNNSPGLIQRNHPFIQEAINVIVRRAELIEGVEKGQQVRRELEAKLDTWLNKAHTLVGGATLKYQVTSRDGTAINLLENAGQGQWQDFTCLASLRNVEPTIGLILTDQPLDEERDRKPQPFE